MLIQLSSAWEDSAALQALGSFCNAVLGMCSVLYGKLYAVSFDWKADRTATPLQRSLAQGFPSIKVAFRISRLSKIFSYI